MAGRRGVRRRRYESTRRREIDDDEDSPPSGIICTMCLFILFVTIWIMRQDIPSDRTGIHDPHAENKNALTSLMDSVSGHTDPPFVASKFKYGFPVAPTSHTLPPPIQTNQTTVVLVLSSRVNFERRTAIRETWAKRNNNVYFVVGGPDSEDVADKNLTNPLSVSSLLFREQELYGDIIDSIHPDHYRSLPYKLHFGMKWVTQNLRQVNWIVKADDDHIVRVKLLQFFVLRKFNPRHPTVVGGIVVGAPPHRTGKWAEDPKFTGSVYPPWAYGSAGYVVSRAVADYIGSQDDLYYYQGEDAGLGIWLEDSPLQVTFIDTPEFNKDKACEPKYYIIGHDWAIEDLKACFNALGDEIPERKSIIAFDAGRKDQHPEKIAQW